LGERINLDYNSIISFKIYLLKVRNIIFTYNKKLFVVYL